MLGVQTQSLPQWIKVNIFIRNSVLKMNYRGKKPQTFNLTFILQGIDCKCT